MRRYIKLTSASSIISLMGLSWHTIDIHAGYHNSCNLYHCCCLTYYFLLVDPKHFQQSSLITLLRCAELGCLRLSQFFNRGTSAHVLSAQAGTIIAACTKSFLVGPRFPLLFPLFSFPLTEPNTVKSAHHFCFRGVARRKYGHQLCPGKSKSYASP